MRTMTVDVQLLLSSPPTQKQTRGAGRGFPEQVRLSWALDWGRHGADGEGRGAGCLV